MKDDHTSNGWRTAPLKKLAKISAGGSAPQGDEYFGGSNPFVRVQHLDEFSDWVKRWDLITDEAVAQFRLKLFPEGTIVLPKSGASIRLEKRGRLTTDAYLVSHLAAINPNLDTVDADFLFYVLRARRLAREKADGYPTLKLSELAETQVPLPPLHEQREIASILGAVRKVQEASERVIAGTRQFRISLVRHVFTNGPVPAWAAGRTPLKESEIGPVPRHWQLRTLGSVSEISTGTTPATQITKYYKGTIPFIKTAEIANNRIRDASTYVTDEAVRHYRLKIYPPGTVFLAMYGQGKTRGQAALLEIRGTTSQNTAAISPKEEVLSEFLWMYLLSRYSELRGEGIQGHISHLNLSYVSKLLIPIPPMEEQRKIVADLSAVDKKISAGELHVVAVRRLFTSALHGLVTGRSQLLEAISAS